MISPVCGDVSFSDGLQFKPHEPLSSEHTRDSKSHELLAMPGWTRHFLGYHPSEYGSFDVEAISDHSRRIKVVLLSHEHEFYERDTPQDAERHIFHKGILHADLLGQREFSWGSAFCRYDPRSLKDWLIVAYATESRVPMTHSQLIQRLQEYEPVPRSK